MHQLKFEDENTSNSPEWIVTFGDMMSLLLTFFILLVSMSEVKSEKKFREIADSLRLQFGVDTLFAGLLPSSIQPRDPQLALMVTSGRSRKQRVASDNQPAASSGSVVAPVRSSTAPQLGLPMSQIAFQPQRDDLSEAARQALQSFFLSIADKPGTIELRGYVRDVTGSNDEGSRDSAELTFARCRRIQQFLVEEVKVDPSWIRIAVADQRMNEPAVESSTKFLQTESVDIYLLEHVAIDR